MLGINGKCNMSHGRDKIDYTLLPMSSIPDNYLQSVVFEELTK